MGTQVTVTLPDALYRQQAGELTEAERPELVTAMQVYRIGLPRKVETLAEAVRRRLHGPRGP